MGRSYGMMLLWLLAVGSLGDGLGSSGLGAGRTPDQRSTTLRDGLTGPRLARTDRSILALALATLATDIGGRFAATTASTGDVTFAFAGAFASTTLRALAAEVLRAGRREATTLTGFALALGQS